MQFQKNSLTQQFFSGKNTALLITGLFLYSVTFAQLGTTEFGKNRVQYKKFKWAYFQTDNFNSYYSQNGEPLAKYVAQLAEKELPDIESFVEYGLQRRANIVVYNSYDEMVNLRPTRHCSICPNGLPMAMLIMPPRTGARIWMIS
jgi:hypothetical protein